VSRGAFSALLGGTLALTLAFLLLPVIAIFLRISPVDLVRQLGSEAAVDAILVTAKLSLISHVLILVVGTPAAYLLATRRFRGRDVVITLTELPLVLPPAVAGIGLLAAFGRRGLLGETFDAFGLQIPFTQIAVVMAVVFVASPFYLRSAIAAFAAVEPDLIAAARTLGASPARVFRRVAMPLSLGGLGAGSTLAFARGLGEFGATLLFAGSFPGRTQTLSLAIYAQSARDFDTALALGALLVVLSVVILLSSKVVVGWASSRSTSPSRSVTSPSSSLSA
jgi:molybdate transport system permease protein